MSTTKEQLEYFRDNRKNALCVVSDDSGKVIQSFPRTKQSDAIKWCSDCVRVGMSISMWDVKHKDGITLVFSDKPELTPRQRAQARSAQVNGEAR